MGKPAALFKPKRIAADATAAVDGKVTVLDAKVDKNNVDVNKRIDTTDANVTTLAPAAEPAE